MFDICTTDPKSAKTVYALVHTLLDVFDTTRDLHRTLVIKEQRDFEAVLRSKGYPSSREDQSLCGEEEIIMDKAAVKRQYEIGFLRHGAEFAVGDGIAETSLQSQIIKLQSILITTFLYGPTSTDSISHQLSKLNIASRTAGIATADILRELQHRQQEGLPLTPRSTHSHIARSSLPHETLYPDASGTIDTGNTALVKYNESPARNNSLVNTTVLARRARPKLERTDTDTTSSPAAHGLYCPYANYLQRHRNEQLVPSITSESQPSCPHCKGTLHLSPGKSWELFKEDKGFDRCFQVSNRFVVKCHRNGPDGQYACVLCSDSGSVNTVCGDVKALVKHLWTDHTIRELKHEEDIVEVIEKSIGSRRDSGTGHGKSRSNRRSVSGAPSTRRKSLPGVEREVDVFDLKSLRRHM